jgi:phosphoadenosine phosphosulfate reductase
MVETVEKVRQETDGLGAEELLAYALDRYGDRVALASSFGAEDQVVTDMLARRSKLARVFTLDTGRLPQETYDVLDATRKKYGLTIRVLFPDREQVEAMVAEQGVNLFYQSIENRKRCCEVRKVIPLKRELATLDAWITGLRREQSAARQQVQRVSWDEGNGLLKFNPLADWTWDEVWTYIRKNDVPYNALHDRHYPSIGCAPCTRAVADGEDPRGGRWWWEQDQQRECGLHVVNGRLVRAKSVSSDVKEKP